MACRGNGATSKPEPRPDCNSNKSPIEVVPEDFNEGVNATKVLVEDQTREALSIVQLQKLAERTLESPPETKGVIRSLEFYFWYSETINALLMFRALQVLDYLIHCGPRQFEHWAKGNIDRLQEVELHQEIARPSQGSWALIGSYAKDLVRVLSDPELLVVERGWSELWSSRVETTPPFGFQCWNEEPRPRVDRSGFESGVDEQLPPYPGPRTAQSSSSKAHAVPPNGGRHHIITPTRSQSSTVPVYPDIEEVLSLSASTQAELGEAGDSYQLRTPMNDNPTIPDQLLGARVSSKNAF